MKVKLLKKVRKRYKIEYVTNVNDNSLWFYRTETPFYLVTDNNNWWRETTCASKEESINLITNWIRHDYLKTTNRPQMISNKVWYK